jgi:exopolyphosphatase / guanosine-5'-triphosphate,3'-diphosphate pyrophosphatase
MAATVLHVDIAAEHSSFRVGDDRVVVDVGESTLLRSFDADPPRPDELSNAIGVVHDHLDDVLRELPEAIAVETVEVTGPGVRAVADVEVGATATLPLVLERDAAEEVFRTVATERRTRRALNPGLAADRVDVVLGAACMLVAMMRRLHLDRVDIVAEPAS